ncbi:threonine aldolase [Actinomycetota bacterium]|nr:threonine aldolase [Actinomycetota bacterium]
MVYEMYPQSRNPEAQFVGFASDNYAAAHPNVIKWIEAANADYARPYNDDIYTKKFRSIMNDIFGKEVSTFPSLNGTGTNVLCLRAVLPRWGTVCAPETAHINTDEAGAPEHMAGLKIMTAPTKNGKILPSDIIDLSRALGDIHSAQPAIVTISNTTERGTVYSADEIGALCASAHSRGMLVHVDGARIFNATVTNGYTSTAQGMKALYGDTGVDVISFGGTKVGAISAEAVVVLHPEGSDLWRGAKFSQKQMGQLSSKARYLSAQFLALFEDDLAHKLAAYSNDKMSQLFDKYLETTNAVKSEEAYLSGATSAYASGNNTLIGDSMHHFEEDLYTYQSKPDANAFFPTLPTVVVNKLRETHHFYDVNSTNFVTTIRLMTSFSTTDDEIDGLITAIKNATAFM